MLNIKKSILRETWPVMDRLAEVVLTHIEGCIVEIGMGKHSTRIWAKHSKTFQRKFYACDSSTRIVEAIKKAPYTHDLMEIFHGKSGLFMQQFDDSPAIVFLDGNHNEQVVRQEVHFFIEKMQTGGVIFMHDTMPLEGYYEAKLENKNREMSTYKVRQELERMPHIDVFTWPYTSSGCGLTMVLKKDMERKFYRL